MKSQLEYHKIFAYSQKFNKYFYSEFSTGVNIVYGRNTSGKSTLIQAIHYTFGINDEKHKLEEILNEDVIFRLDFSLKRNGVENITIIRENEIIYIIRSNEPSMKFIGIGSNNSQEHIKLKEYLSELIGFELKLESSGEYKTGSIESMFLPYYVAQDYGWVLALKSFRGLDYFKNFKNDYYDYYLGILNDYDRLEKQRYENEKKIYEGQIGFLNSVEQTDEELLLTKLMDESFIEKTNEYIDAFKTQKSNLVELEKDYIFECNKLSYLEQRLSLLKRVLRAVNIQKPLDDNCPACSQPLPSTMEDIYRYHQDINDTRKQIAEINESILLLKKEKGKINTLKGQIESLKEDVRHNYELLQKYKTGSLSYETWLYHKANAQLLVNVDNRKNNSILALEEVSRKLKKFKTEEEIISIRNSKDESFKIAFKRNLEELGVKMFDNVQYLSLYKMGLFPKQGVELLKTLLAYYFAFNRIIESTPYVHRFPFMLDAIFKEDIDKINKELILKFISTWKPNDTQIIFSIAESTDAKRIADYNTKFFRGTAKLIETSIQEERVFLKTFDVRHQRFLDETLDIIQNT